MVAARNFEKSDVHAHPDTIYLNPFYNTKDVGPIVLEIPTADENASITGSVDDAWQTAIEDVGPTGGDKGKGGKYVILPPGYTDKVPDGYIPMPSPTYTSFAILRSNLKSGSDADIAKAVDYGKRVKVYPLSQATNPPDTKFVDAIDTVFDSRIPYDLRFFQTLDRFVQREPWLERDKAMIGTLKTIGIEKGKTFAPKAPSGTESNWVPQMRAAALKFCFASMVRAKHYFEKTWVLPDIEKAS